jgi:hypothetical protein
MKRFLIVMILVLFLTSCEGSVLDCKENDNVAGICVDTTAPVIEGADNVTIFLGEEFDVLDGIEAIDDLDGDITSNIVVSGNVNTEEIGTYFVRYTVEDGTGNSDIVLRYVEVVYDYRNLDNILFNGDFSFGLSNVTMFTYDPALASYDVINEEMVIDIEGVDDGVWYSPRLSLGNIVLEYGSSYHVSFKAKATDVRMIQVQVGELLDSSPWYLDFATTIDKVIELDTHYTLYEFDFTMYAPTNENVSILFEMGDIGSENHVTTVYIDSIRIVESNSYDIPNISSRIEAEDFIGMDGVDTEVTGDVEGMLNVGWLDTGDYLVYRIYVDEAGYYSLDSRIASPEGLGSFELYKDDDFLTSVGMVMTGDWQSYTTISSDMFYLEVGTYDFKVLVINGGFNLNYFDFEKVN